MRVSYFRVLIIRILRFRVVDSGPLFSETPIFVILSCMFIMYATINLTCMTIYVILSCTIGA